MLLGTFTLLSLTGRHPTESPNLQAVWGWGWGWLVQLCFFSLLGNRATLQLCSSWVGNFMNWTERNCIYIYFFQSGPNFRIRWRENRGGGGGGGVGGGGVLDPLPPGFNPLPPPNFFLSTPAPFFSGYPRPKFRFFAPAPHPSDPPPIFRQNPPYPRPLNPRAPCPPHVSDKHIFLSHEILLWSLEAMNLMASRLHNILWYDVLYIRRHIIWYCEFSKPWDWLYIYYTAAEVPATFQSDRTILNTNFVASKNLQDVTIRRLIRCFNIR